MATVAQLMRDGEDLIDDATKEDLADCAKVLAVALTLYQRRYGDLDLSEAHAAPNQWPDVPEEVAEEFSSAMQTFVSVLSEVVEDNKGRTLH
jgi:hypothetical protein